VDLVFQLTRHIQGGPGPLHDAPPLSSAGLGAMLDSTKEIAFLLRSVHDSLLLRTTCLTAEYARTRFQKNRLHTSIPADYHSSGVRSLFYRVPRLSRAISWFCAQRALRDVESARDRPEPGTRPCAYRRDLVISDSFDSFQQ
jgi:hypothetical protein